MDSRHNELTKDLFDGKRDKYLARVLSDGRRAEDLEEFMQDWMQTEKEKALDALEEDDTPNTAQSNYKAAIRLYQYLKNVIAQAKSARTKGE